MVTTRSSKNRPTPVDGRSFIDAGANKKRNTINKRGTSAQPPSSPSLSPDGKRRSSTTSGPGSINDRSTLESSGSHATRPNGPSMSDVSSPSDTDSDLDSGPASKHGKGAKSKQVLRRSKRIVSKEQPVFKKPLLPDSNRPRRAHVRIDVGSGTHFLADGLALGRELRPRVPDMSRWQSKRHTPRARPLPNPGSWCYRRALLQSLICTPQFFNLLGHHCREGCPRACVTCALRSFARAYLDPSTMPDDVNRRLRSVDYKIETRNQQILNSQYVTREPRWPHNAVTDQQDAHEFLLYLLDVIEAAQPREIPRLVHARGKESRRREQKRQADSSRPAALVERSIFEQSFKIVHEANWACECGKGHTQLDAGTFGLTLPIHPRNGEASLATCLEHYHLERDVDIRCERCGASNRNDRTRRITALPEALLVHVARFQSDGLGGTSKLMDHIEIPENLDTMQWVKAGVARTVFRLHAVVFHSGSLKGGHYVARFQTPKGIAHANDGHGIEYLESFWQDLESFTPYLVVYLRA